MAIRSIPMLLEPHTCDGCDTVLVEKLDRFECPECDETFIKRLPRYFTKLNTKKEAYQIIKDLFDDVLVLNESVFEAINGYKPVVASIFIVSLGGSYSYTLNGEKCSILNGTLQKLGNLQIAELQRAYVSNQAPNLPRGKRTGLGYNCPECEKVVYTKQSQNTVLCKNCKCIFYV